MLLIVKIGDFLGFCVYRKVLCNMAPRNRTGPATVEVWRYPGEHGKINRDTPKLIFRDRESGADRVHVLNPRKTTENNAR